MSTLSLLTVLWLLTPASPDWERVSFHKTEAACWRQAAIYLDKKPWGAGYGHGLPAV